MLPVPNKCTGEKLDKCKWTRMSLGYEFTLTFRNSKTAEKEFCWKMFNQKAVRKNIAKRKTKYKRKVMKENKSCQGTLSILKTYPTSESNSVALHWFYYISRFLQRWFGWGLFLPWFCPYMVGADTTTTGWLSRWFDLFYDDTVDGDVTSFFPGICVLLPSPSPPSLDQFVSDHNLIFSADFAGMRDIWENLKRFDIQSSNWEQFFKGLILDVSCQ